MFKKMMAKLGKGGATVDLVLEGQDYLPGENVHGQLVIQGGTIEQEINKIDIELMMYLHSGKRELNHLLERFPFHQAFTILPGEKKSFPFSSHLPDDLPVSGNKVAYFFNTHLDIAQAVDHSDHDYIKVHPPHPLQKVLDAFAELGLREKYDSRSFNGYTQEFTLFPTSFLKGHVEEVEFVVGIEDQRIHLLLEVDIFTWTGEREIRYEIYIEKDEWENHETLSTTLRSILTNMTENPSSYRIPTKHGYHKHSGLSKWGGTVGGFATGALGAIALSEWIDDMDGTGDISDSLGDALSDIGDLPFGDD
ncbi:sporulation-control protein [Marininema mesophilum]|uniref:Sporulation-control protein n=1 Tax=Marininema mesophilum TaxID=1048340 RepID=A0A1H2WF53_9BACL|nr:sporulation protein [Marininema mesophilum]SDW79313.1 sporulation-control protein [Marininema mesophilum]